jgi:hypothetical protein
MNTSYRFSSDTEPSKEDLDALMQDVLKDVEERATQADATFRSIQAQNLEQIRRAWNTNQQGNDD